MRRHVDQLCASMTTRSRGRHRHLRRQTNGQSLLEFALLLPLMLLLVLGGLGIGLSILAASQVQMAAFHGASIAVRTDGPVATGSGPCSLSSSSSAATSCSCPSTVVAAVQSGVFQSLNASGNSGTTSSSTPPPSSESIYGVIPLNTIGGTVSCSNDFARAQSTTPGSGVGSPNTVTVTLTGDIAVTFIPLISPSVSISQSATAVVEPYRSRS